MTFYYLDASAWVKRYYEEIGTAWVQGLFAQDVAMACASLGLVEVMATLARKRKSGDIPHSMLVQKTNDLEEDWDHFIHIQLTAEAVHLAKNLASDLALRGADAVHLASAFLLHGHLEEDDRLIIVTSDHELKESAQVSGLAVLDPEEQEEQDVRVQR